MSIETDPGPEFLKQKYDLHNAPETERAVERVEHRTGETISNSPDARIGAYLGRIKNVLNPPKLEGHENLDRRERNISMLKQSLYDQFVIKPEEIPESYFEHQKQLAREQGHGDIEITPEARQQLTEVIVTDQETTLDNWVDYLASDDAIYPDWLKYWAMRSVLTMGGYDKERHAFSKRSKGTTKPFPDLNREALAYVLDVMQKKYSEGVNLDNLEGEERKQFEKLLSGENFSKLYAWAIEKVTPASVEQISVTDGKWIKFPKGTDPTTYIPDGFDTPLVQSLEGHGTGWCTAGESTARTQLQAGDFYVYYSVDQNNKPIIPRVAIRMEENQIGEVRGIAAEQNLDPYIGEVVQEKLQEFPDGKEYEKKAGDMKQLTIIEKKTKTGEELTKDELIFLYEINSSIEGFGYQKDPRIEEITSQRDPKEDAPIVFDCQPEEIAWGQDQINENTKAYIGPLFPGIFAKLQDLEYIAASFPEGITHRQNDEIGGKSEEQLEQEMRDKNINISDYSKYVLHSPEFTTLPTPEQIQTIRLRVKDLGFPNGATTNEIYTRAAELGLELCPAELGPHMRLKDTEQKLNDWYAIAMKPIADRRGYPDVFCLGRHDDGLWLAYLWASPGSRWGPDDGLVFCLRQVSTET